MLVGSRLGGNAVIETGGTLTIDIGAMLSGNVSVNSRGTLGGLGTIGGNAQVNGTLSPGNSIGWPLWVRGNLTLSETSTSVFELNTLNSDGTGRTGTDLVNVQGNLTLGGTLDARVGAAGYYRIFNYWGALTGEFGDVELTGAGGFVPTSATIDTRPVSMSSGEVNLAVVSAGQTLQFWNGTDSDGSGVVDGGRGVWSANGSNWTGQPGQAAINGSWSGSVAVFAGAAGGAVTVEGAQNFDTLQFSASDYELSGGTLVLAPAERICGEDTS